MRLFFAALAVLSLAGHARAAEQVVLLDGAVTLTLPEELTPLSEEIAKEKYFRSNKVPRHIYSDATTKISLAIDNRDGEIEVSQAFADAMKTLFSRMMAVSQWIAADVREFGGKKVVYLELETPALETDQYGIRNRMFITKSGDLNVFINYNCTTDLMAECDAIQAEFLDTISIR